MKLVTLDLSTKTGVSVLLAEGNGERVEVLRLERIALPKPAIEYGTYPENYLRATEVIASRVCALLDEEQPDKIVIEETNLGKARSSQRILEWIHRAVLERLRLGGMLDKVIYVSSSEWRKALSLKLSSDQRAQNIVMRRASKQGKERLAEVKKKTGLKGKVTQKHLALDYVNARFGWKGTEAELIMKDNDLADALALGLGWLAGAKVCDGK